MIEDEFDKEKRERRASLRQLNRIKASLTKQVNRERRRLEVMQEIDALSTTLMNLRQNR